MRLILMCTFLRRTRIGLDQGPSICREIARVWWINRAGNDHFIQSIAQFARFLEPEERTPFHHQSGHKPCRGQ